MEPSTSGQVMHVDGGEYDGDAVARRSPIPVDTRPAATDYRPPAIAAPTQSLNGLVRHVLTLMIAVNLIGMHDLHWRMNRRRLLVGDPLFLRQAQLRRRAHVQRQSVPGRIQERW